MKTILSAIIFFCFMTKVYSQDYSNCNYLNFICFVDGELVHVYDGVIIIANKDSTQIDSVKFTNHNYGTIIFDHDNWIKLKQVDKNQNVKLSLSCVDKKTFIEKEYEECLSLKWLNYGFIIFRVYNFENKKNWKEFYQRKGYGIEWQASDRFKVIDRRKKWKSRIR